MGHIGFQLGPRGYVLFLLPLTLPIILHLLCYWSSSSVDRGANDRRRYRGWYPRKYMGRLSSYRVYWDMQVLWDIPIILLGNMLWEVCFLRLSSSPLLLFSPLLPSSCPLSYLPSYPASSMVQLMVNRIGRFTSIRNDITQYRYSLVHACRDWFSWIFRGRKRETGCDEENWRVGWTDFSREMCGIFICWYVTSSVPFLSYFSSILFF